MPDFAHLHVHSHYSLLEALPQVDELVKFAKKQGYKALALTDNGNMFGTIEFIEECRKAEIKPIIGIDAYMAVERLQDKRHRVDDKTTRLVLLAENMTGYHNLIQLATVGYLEGFYYRPRIDRVVLKERRDGLIAIMGARSDVLKLLLEGEREKAEARLAEYLGIFDKDHLYFEIQHQPDVAATAEANAAILEFARAHGLGVVGTRLVYYLTPDEAEGRKLSLCVRDGRTLEERERVVESDPDYSMPGPEEMLAAFKDCPEALENVAKIVARCDVPLELGKWNFPNFEIPEGHTPISYLKELAYAGLKRIKGRDLNKAEIDRLEYEIDVVDKKGYATYFLVVSDYTSWARSQGIISVARGSAAASLMAYSIGITTIDPLEFRLPFERFLNPLRPSAPDIDMDFADSRRGEVIEYVKRKYGADHVAQICTFGTMAARGSVRDTGRALGYPLDFVDQISKMIPFGSQGFTMTIAKALKETPELQALYDTDPRVKRLLDLAQLIEGNARQCSVHAAGVVISDKPLIEYAPLQRESGGENIITQYEMHAVEAAGVLKMDFLGLRNLSILGTAIRLVKRTKGVDVDLYHMPLDDKLTYEMLARGETMGLFQLNGDGMTKWLVQLKPTNIFDIVAMVALYRPGPIEIIPDYIKRKHHPETITYMDPRMKEYLQDSLGLFIYQEDLLLTSIHIAGYDWAEADKFRKAVGKKIPEEMAKQEAKFKEGVVKHGGLTPQKAEAMWKYIEPFASYGFNKGHAAAYAVVAYQTAYLKAHYPAEYMTAMMTAESHDLDTIADAVRECKAMGIEVLPPDVGESEADFTYVDDKHVRFGLKTIKNLGDDTVHTVVEERQAHGPFRSLEDFASRVAGKAFNKKALEALAKSGAFGALAERRAVLENLDLLLAYNKNAQRERASGQGNLFAVPGGQAEPAKLTLRSVPPAEKRDVLAWEKELLGLYVSAHPFADLEKGFAGLLEPIPQALAKPDKAPVRVGGNLKTVKRIQTKKGEPMLFVQLEDTAGECEVIVFPRTLAENAVVWAEGANVAVTGRVSLKDDERKIIADRGWSLADETKEIYKKHFRGEPISADELINAKPKVVTAAGEVRVTIPEKLPLAKANALKAVLAKYPGHVRACLEIKGDAALKRIETSYCVEPKPDLVRELEAVVGFGNVKVVG